MWRSRLRIRYCRSCGTGHNCCAGSIPGPGTSMCFEYSNKKRRGGLNKGFSSGRLSKRQDLFDESNMTVNVSGARHTLFCGFRWVFVLLVVVFFGGRASLCY